MADRHHVQRPNVRETMVQEKVLLDFFGHFVVLGRGAKEPV